MTSPPFALKRKKEYGNVHATDYIEWFLPFAEQMKRIIRDDGSIIIDIGGTWIKGKPTRSLYHFKLLIALVEELGLHLAQEFYWYNPSKLPSPAEWVTVRRIRVKDAVNTVWWLSKTPQPKASNRRVLKPYSKSMKALLKKGYKAKKRPSGHDISKNFSQDNGGAIPPNLIELANTDSNGSYLKQCREAGIKPHPARFPHGLPEFFIKFLTDEGDYVVDPFAGSVVTGEVCENLKRHWIGIEMDGDYLQASKFRFPKLSDKPHQLSLDLPEKFENATEFSKEEKQPKPVAKHNGSAETKVDVNKRTLSEVSQRNTLPPGFYLEPSFF